MMEDPGFYLAGFEKASYNEMIAERNRLMLYLLKFEKAEKEGDRSSGEWVICPSPDVRYQIYMEYLSGLLLMMRNKYNEEYVWGDKKLSDPIVKRKVKRLLT